MRKYLKNLYGYVINGAPHVFWITVLLGFSICLLLSTCHRAARQTVQNPIAKPVLSASPNPVPAGDPDQPLGATTITWDTGDGTIGDLYVKVDRAPEVFMARAPSGTHGVGWIQSDSFYEFRLYGKKHSKLLARVEVTRDD